MPELHKHYQKNEYFRFKTAVSFNLPKLKRKKVSCDEVHNFFLQLSVCEHAYA